MPKKTKPFQADPFSDLDKRVRVRGPVDFYIDNDDVDTYANKMLIEHLLYALNRGWKTGPEAWHCQNEDCDRAYRPVHTVGGDDLCVGCGEPCPWQPVEA